jgi:hypothetical protein
MSINIWELRKGSRDGDFVRQTRRYGGNGIGDDDNAARVAFLAYVQTYAPYSGVVPFDPQSVDVTYLGPGVCEWICTVQYRWHVTRPPIPGEQRFAFDNLGNTQRIFFALPYSTPQEYGPPGMKAPVSNGAIGITDNSIEGVDIETSIFAFTIRTALDPSKLNMSNFIANLNDSAKTVNESAWIVNINMGLSGSIIQPLKFAPFQVFFRGVTGDDQRGDGLYDLVYSFIAGPNVSDQTIGSGSKAVQGVSKYAHQYLWIRSKDIVDTSATPPNITKQIIGVYVDDVYELTDFTTLGLK